MQAKLTVSAMTCAMATSVKSGVFLLAVIQLICLTPRTEGSVINRYRRATVDGDACNAGDPSTACDAGFDCVSSLLCQNYSPLGDLCTHACFDLTVCDSSGGVLATYNGGTAICTCTDADGGTYSASSCTIFLMDPCAGIECSANTHCQDGLCVCIDTFVSDASGCRDVNECPQQVLQGSGICDPFDTLTGSDECVNTDGGYKCTCAVGFELNPGPGCTDIDECTIYPDICIEFPGSQCVNHPGHYVCQMDACPEGTIDQFGDGYVCLGVNDKCYEYQCMPHAFCETDPQGNPHCFCSDGYEMPGTECMDKNECEDAVGIELCSQAGSIGCEDIGGSFLCECLPGFTNNGPECVDDNECLMQLQIDGLCYPGNAATFSTGCVNNVGSFECTCMGGYHFEDIVGCVDTDECTGDPCGTNEACVNTDGGYTCQCASGYEGSPCTDIDECVVAPPCAENALCDNNEGGYSCSCDPGYEHDEGPPPTCTDVDECSQADMCESDEVCVNNDGSYVCECANGYIGTAPDCTDVDECAEDAEICGLNNVCTNEPGTFSCACATGYIDMGSGPPLECEDVDECSQADICESDEVCVNNDGSYMCECANGYVGTSPDCTDVDECAEDAEICGLNNVCTNEPGTYSCACATGYIDMGSGPQLECEDVDECSQADSCGADEVCVNNEGSYTCECSNGYVGTAPDCTDLDECIAAETTCGANSICTNNIGSFSCACAEGYTGSGTPPLDCQDKNECVETPGICEDGICTNEPGSYSCQCADGYTGIWPACTDIDECAQPNICGENTVCTNVEGSHSCACAEGFTGSGTPLVCENIDECLGNVCGTNEDCLNLPAGSYTCVCASGYSGPLGSCEDINECEAETPPCMAEAECHNEMGWYSCQCLPGYEGQYCVDINECDNYHQCGENAHCHNMNGSYRCHCMHNYEGTPPNCHMPTIDFGTDIDGHECHPGEDECADHGTCQYVSQQFQCQCDDGYHGDGVFDCHADLAHAVHLGNGEYEYLL